MTPRLMAALRRKVGLEGDQGRAGGTSPVLSWRSEVFFMKLCPAPFGLESGSQAESSGTKQGREWQLGRSPLPAEIELGLPKEDTCGC